ncbi:MAG: hypothetical protein H6657_05915 [Ardenticatenaceae bacterium]|nr:hypothetical protein [Ardenticatenaceae bacterium]
MERGQILRLVGVITAVCLLGTAVVLVISRLIWGTALNEPTTIEVQIDAPEQVTVNEPFAVTIQVTSLITSSQLLHSIDLDTDYLENVRLSGSAPAYQAVQSLPLTHFASYRFETEIPAKNSQAIELMFVGETVGEFSGVVDICLEDGTLCLAQQLQTKIVE